MKVAAILTAMVLVCVNPFHSVSNAYVRLADEPKRMIARTITTEKITVVKEVHVKTSAYYAPTRNQGGKYATGSFAGDVKLNGSGKITKFTGKNRKKTEQ